MIVALFSVAGAARADEASVPRSTAIDFATPQSVIDLGPSAAPRALKDPSDPNGAWFTIAVQNRGATPAARVLNAADPPGAGLAITPPAGRPMLLEAAASDPAVVIERAVAFGPNAFRVFIPPGRSATLALHFANVDGNPTILAWTESALIANN